MNYTLTFARCNNDETVSYIPAGTAKTLDGAIRKAVAVAAINELEVIITDGEGTIVHYVSPEGRVDAP